MIITRQRFLWVIYALVLTVTIGVTGYMIIEGWSFFDALYMTIVTLSTVGYQEVHDLSTAGKIFSIALILGGVGSVLYTLTTIVQYIVEGNFANLFGRRRMRDKISKLKQHVILCGYGRVGQEVAHVFKSEGTPFIIVELDQEAIALAAEHNYLYLQGDATINEVLKEAGINRARALIAALGSDADNLYLTLSAKGLHPDLFIVARTVSEESEPKLKQAGANRIMSPYRIGGRRMAMLALRPLVVDFIDTTMHSQGRELVLENIKVSPGSPVDEKTVQEAGQYCGGASILAIKKEDGNLLTNPSQKTLLELGDELVIIGTREQLRTLEGSI